MPSSDQPRSSLLSAMRPRNWVFIVPLLWIGAICALNKALLVNLGFYWPSALFWLSVGGLLMLLTVPFAYRSRIGGKESNFVFAAIGLALLWQFYTLTTQSISSFRKPVPIELRSQMVMAVVIAGALVFVGFIPLVYRNFRLDCARFVMVLAAFTFLNVLVVKASPSPSIDVWDLHQLSCEALLHGQNPYALTIPDKYHDDINYGPEIQKDGRLLFGYCYPPLSLLLTLPGYLLFGDHRYSQVAALTLSGLLLGFARPSSYSFAAASLFLFTPRLFFVVEKAWTEPIVILGLTTVVFCACRKPKLLLGALGLFLATKQYLVMALPVFGFWSRDNSQTKRDFSRFYSVPALTALLITLPFLLWDAKAFYHSAFWIYTKFPASDSSLSYLTWLRENNIAAPDILAFVAALIAALTFAVLWTKRRSLLNREQIMAIAPSWFAAAMAVMLFLFFAWSKRSFCNHYFFVIAALCAAVATWPRNLDAENNVAKSGT